MYSLRVWRKSRDKKLEDRLLQEVVFSLGKLKERAVRQSGSDLERTPPFHPLFEGAHALEKASHLHRRFLGPKRRRPAAPGLIA